MVEKLTTYKSENVCVCVSVSMWVMFLHTRGKKIQHSMSVVFFSVFHFFLRFGLNDIWYSLNSIHTKTDNVYTVYTMFIFCCAPHTLDNLRCVPYVILCTITMSNDGTMMAVNMCYIHRFFPLHVKSYRWLRTTTKFPSKILNTDFCSFSLPQGFL